MLLVRPYPVAQLARARVAISRAAAGDVKPLQGLYRAAVDALASLDPDEVDEFADAWPSLDRSGTTIARAAQSVADAWEGVVCLGARIEDPGRFQEFAWLV